MKRNKLIGKYPSADHINNALRNLLNIENPTKEIDDAIDELIYALLKADGYIHDDNWDKISKREKWTNFSWSRKGYSVLR
jgi:hypothetical protein